MPRIADSFASVSVPGSHEFRIYEKRLPRVSAPGMKFVDFALSPAGQQIGLDVKEFAIPTNRGVTLPAQVPNLSQFKVIDYDFAKYGASAERRRLLERWENEINKK